MMIDDDDDEDDDDDDDDDMMKCETLYIGPWKVSRLTWSQTKILGRNTFVPKIHYLYNTTV